MASNCKEKIKKYKNAENKKCKFSFSSSSTELNKSKTGSCPIEPTSLSNIKYPKQFLHVERRNYSLQLVQFPVEILKGIHSLKFSQTLGFYVCGYGNGDIEMREEMSNRLLAKTTLSLDGQDPVVSLCFHPKLSHFLFAACSYGKIHLIKTHSFTGKLLFEQKKNELHSIDVSSTGNLLFSGGKDGQIRVYDVQAEKVVRKFEGHRFRVFCVKYDFHTNLVISGGWDKFVKIWDLREQNAIKTIKGPYICGDAIDMRGSIILTGSWVETDSIQLWDFGTSKLLHTFRATNRHRHFIGEYVYCCKFLQTDTDAEKILVGGTDALEVLNWKKRKITERLEVPKTVQTLDDKQTSVIFGGMEPLLRIAKFKEL
ncbi:uncharacterized protein LOC108740621 [Agrilus planipennis]|uniref:Uncharacterized protein LOC108740621 n=1 Tax=Agrilus planipennis TaxID=224129 RepID=A0A1W4X333_AGRPL|nr:uncharacterized protein LOC108740621 [Agrilus planipennis]